MKKIFKSLLFAIALVSPVLFFNCAEEQLPAGVQLSLVQQRLHLATTSASFGYNSNLTQTISVTGENTPWTLTGLPDWLTASATTGNGAATITLTAKENTSGDNARAAVLTFASTAADYQYSKTISVSQPVAIAYITPSEGAFSFMPKGETKTVGITANVDWTATCSDTHFTVEKVNSMQLRVTAKENLEKKTQKATIQLMRSGTNTTITTISVTQAEAGVTGSTDNIPFAVDGETKTTAITSDATWTATVSDASWLTVTPADGSDGTATLTIKAEANTSDGARSGYVYVRIGSTNKLAIPVSQAGVKFSVSSSTVTLKSTTEATTLNVTANATWKVISKPEWLNATLPETLVGTVSLTLTPQDNPNTTPRTGQLVIGREGFSGNQTIAVTQEGKTFGELTAQMDFPVTASTQTVTVETDGAWTTTTSTSWIHLSPSNGQGRSTLQVSVDANPGKDERTGAFTITVGKTTQTVSVKQVGRYIILSCDDLITKSTPTTVNLFVSANMDWTATSNADWLTVEPKQGEGDAALTISVADNPSLSKRTGTITVQSGEVTQAFSFTQPGRTLSLNISTETPITLPAAGGSSNAITVTTEGTYKVTASEEWLTIQESGNTFTITASTTNSISDREGTVTVALTGLIGEEKLERTITVKQKGATLEVNETTLSFSAIGGTSEAITVTTDISYIVTTSEDWLTVNKSDKTFTITANKNNSINKRSALVTITVTGLVGEEILERIISVEQDPLSLQVSEKYLSFPATGGTSDAITITTDATYRIITSEDWLAVNESDKAFTITVNKINSIKRRSAIVTITLTGLVGKENLEHIISVEQDPLSLQVSETSLSFPADGGTSDAITITTDGTYRIITSEDWLTVKESNKAFTITADKTNSIKRRSAIVTITLTDLVGEEKMEHIISVEQEPLSLQVSETSLSFPAVGGTSDVVTVSTDGTYQLTASEDWITVNKSSNTFTITAPRTNSINQRSGTVTVSLTNLSGEEQLERVITVHQNPLTLTVEPTSVTFTNEGGTSESITVTTDGNYTITSSDTWLTVKQTNNTFTVKATENNGAARTATVTIALTGLKSGESKQVTVTVTQNAGEDPLGLCPNKKHPHAIDMGLTVNGKKVKFACCNVGAELETHPQVQYGDYFAWGEISGYNSGKTIFNWSTYKWCNGSSSTMTKYCKSSSYGTVDKKTQLELSDDAARANWGGSWRMPTIDELSALYNTSNCTWTWTTIGGKYGYKVTSKTTNNSIFLPAAGYRDATSLGGDIGSYGNFWSSSLDTSDDNYARYLVFYSSGRRTSSTYRYYGQSVRPVTE